MTPTIISSPACRPNFTCLPASGLRGLFAELSSAGRRGWRPVAAAVMLRARSEVIRGERCARRADRPTYREEMSPLRAALYICHHQPVNAYDHGEPARPLS